MIRPLRVMDATVTSNWLVSTECVRYLLQA